MNKEIKGFIKLATKDISKKYRISKNAVVLLQQIFFYQSGSLHKCIASKDTLAISAKISRRQTFTLLKQLQQKGLIRRLRREIVLSTSFLRWLTELKKLHSACQYWSDHFKVKLQWMWKRCGQSIIRLHKKIFNRTSTPEKLHPNNRFNLIRLNNNNSSRKITIFEVKQIINQLSAEELKEMYLEKLIGTDNKS